jgi:hypothetical protein
MNNLGSNLPTAQFYPPSQPPAYSNPPASNNFAMNLPSIPTEHLGPDAGASNLDDFEVRLANLKKM